MSEESMSEEIKALQANMRRARLDRLLLNWGEESKGLTFQGIPLPDMTREELMATVAFLSHRYNAKAQFRA